MKLYNRRIAVITGTGSFNDSYDGRGVVTFEIYKILTVDTNRVVIVRQ